MPKKKKRKTRATKKMPSVPKARKKPTMTLAVLGLILNVIIIPGLGSIVGGRIKTGIWQLVLTIVGIVLSFVLIGIPIILVAWIWGLVTGIQLIQNAK